MLLILPPSASICHQLRAETVCWADTQRGEEKEHSTEESKLPNRSEQEVLFSWQIQLCMCIYIYVYIYIIMNHMNTYMYIHTVSS